MCGNRWLCRTAGARQRAGLSHHLCSQFVDLYVLKRKAEEAKQRQTSITSIYPSIEKFEALLFCVDGDGKSGIAEVPGAPAKPSPL